MIDYGEVLKAIREIEDSDAEGFTIAEITKVTGWSKNYAREQVRSFIESGKAEFSGKKWVMRIDQRRTPVAAYKLAEGAI